MIFVKMLQNRVTTGTKFEVMKSTFSRSKIHGFLQLYTFVHIVIMIPFICWIDLKITQNLRVSEIKDNHFATIIRVMKVRFCQALTQSYLRAYWLPWPLQWCSKQTVFGMAVAVACDRPMLGCTQNVIDQHRERISSVRYIRQLMRGCFAMKSSGGWL